MVTDIPTKLPAQLQDLTLSIPGIKNAIAIKGKYPPLLFASLFLRPEYSNKRWERTDAFNFCLKVNKLGNKMQNTPSTT